MYILFSATVLIQKTNEYIFYQETGRESISTSDQQASSAGRTDSIGGGDGEAEMREDLYEEAFARMKKAAGVSGTENLSKLLIKFVFSSFW